MGIRSTALAGTFFPTVWGATWQKNKIYVHLLRWNGVKQERGRERSSIDKVLRLAPIAQKIVSNRIFAGGKQWYHK